MLDLLPRHLTDADPFRSLLDTIRDNNDQEKEAEDASYDASKNYPKFVLRVTA